MRKGDHLKLGHTSSLAVTIQVLAARTPMTLRAVAKAVNIQPYVYSTSPHVVASPKLQHYAESSALVSSQCFTNSGERHR